MYESSGGAGKSAHLCDVSLPLVASDVTLESAARSGAAVDPVDFVAQGRFKPAGGSAALGAGVDFSANADGTEVKIQALLKAL